MSAMTALALAAAIVTVGSLIAGISSMTTHGEVGHHTSEEWMVLRVVAQGAALLFIVLALLS